jgi:hypothetical protein
VAASAALVAELAEAAAESAAAPEAGVASVVAGAVLAVSCFAQAVSISAAIRALRASLVFIDQYPERSKCSEKRKQVDLSDDAQFAYRSREFYRVADRFEICVGWERQTRATFASRARTQNPARAQPRCMLNRVRDDLMRAGHRVCCSATPRLRSATPPSPGS